ncbi:uncharacterized protein LOC126401635 isoform X3 [Epinephelus moara]|uniref:uncharacterized protein LOC126401635 isoform X3 n=1 Tax=Epinephelus moara TaxID=300413 RepID=UPI00214E6DFA|nr:uncharacterized protein LOC126401635 isoform X3 [Epinephelus moara]
MLSTRLTIIAFLAASWCWTSDAGGKVTQALSMQHGVPKYADNPGLTCDGMECSSPSPPYTEMFVCSFSDNNFIQITFICKNTNANMRTEVICEGPAAVIKCEKGGLAIVRASFGRFDQNTSTVTPSEMTHSAS